MKIKFRSFKSIIYFFLFMLLSNSSYCKDIKNKKFSSDKVEDIPSEYCTNFKNKLCNYKEVLSWIFECGEGKDSSCLKASNFYSIIKGREVESLSFLDASCSLKNKSSCKKIAQVHDLAKKGKPVEGYKEGCRKGRIENCIIIDSISETDSDLGFIPDENNNQAKKTNNEELKKKTELEKCQEGLIDVCVKNYSYFLKNSNTEKAAPFLMVACADDDYKACAIVAELWSKSGNKKQAEGFLKEAITGANNQCNKNDKSACEIKCGFMAKLNSSALEIDDCLNVSCQKGNIKSCEFRTTLNNQINKQHEDFAIKRKKIDNAIQEGNQREEKFKDLSNTVNQMSKSFNDSINSNKTIEIDSSQNTNSETTADTHSFGGNIGCGIKPIPKIGCRIGRCTDGGWEQICDANSTLSCGIRPIPKIGCRIGRCVDGSWEQVCDSNPTLSCGIKPIPKIGCSIGRCVDGRWEQICN